LVFLPYQPRISHRQSLSPPLGDIQDFSAKKRCGHSSASELSRIRGGGRGCCARFWPFGLTRTLVESPDMKIRWPRLAGALAI